MEDDVKEKLRGLISTQGQQILDNPNKFTSLMLDLCLGNNEREINILAIALTQKIPQRIQSSGDKLLTVELRAYLLHRLENETGLQIDVANWAINTWAEALGLPAISSLEPSDREDLDAMLHSPDYTPSKLIQFFKRNLEKELTADSGVWEGYTIENHTLMVLGQFEKYFGHDRLPGGLDSNTFRVILALHDIGVPAAIHDGTKHGLDKKEAKKWEHPGTPWT